MGIKVAISPQLYVHVRSFSVVRSNQYRIIYSSLLTAYLIKTVWLTVIRIKHFSTLLDVMSHVWLIKIKIRNYFSLKKSTKKLAYCATTKKIDLISLSLNT